MDEGNLVRILQRQDNEIVISLVEQQMVVHDTARIAVNVHAQRDENTNEATMRAAIKTALQKFIVADWRFLSVNRQRGQSRFEVIAVTALARVPEAENVQLVERANAASSTDIQLVSPSAVYALPFDKVQQINRDLRVKLVEQARTECERYNKVSGGHYRVAEVIFADTPRAGANAEVMRAGRAYAQNVGSGSYTVSAPSSEPEAEEGAPDLGVTERFWVAAQVTLRAAT
jgi:hypothetical protein